MTQRGSGSTRSLTWLRSPRSIIGPVTRTALVLSGGALLGVGWELGVLRGLQDGGVDMGGFAKVIGRPPAPW
jgi:predicted acylesterase/phospholipase RssA